MDTSITKYCEHLAAADRSPGTIRVRRHYLSRLDADHPGKLLELGTADLETWLAARAWSRSTKRSAQQTLRVFYAWAHRRGLLPASDPGAALGTVRQPDPDPRPVPAAVYNCAWSRADDQERLMLSLGRLCGLRRAEIAAVHSDDLEDGGILRVRGKGGRIRRVPVPDSALRAAITGADGWLFPGRAAAGHVSADHVGRRIATLLPGRWTAHSLRHAYAASVFKGSRDAFTVRRLLGHSSMETTAAYIPVGDDDLWAAAGWAETCPAAVAAARIA